MKKKVFTVIMLTMTMIFSALPAYSAALRTKLTLVIPETPHDDTMSHEVSADFVDDGGIFIGSHTETSAFTDSEGRSSTETETEFRNIHGEVLMSADVTITARSDDFRIESGEKFAENFSVDVTVSLYDRSYDDYTYTLGIEGLPEWLYADGEILSADALTVGTTRHHYEFSLKGTPETSNDRAVIKFTAVVNVSGDVPVMRATGEKEINVTVETVPKPPYIEPPKSDDVSPDIVPKSPDISPDVVPKSPDVVPESQDVVPRPPDIVPESQDVVPKPPDYIETRDEMPDTSSGGTVSLSDIVSNMTTAEKTAVRTLKVNSNVSDLAGIEEFTNLERLDLKEAVKLETVDLRGNSSVKSVDVSGNVAVKTLTLTGSRVETLDAHGCENLEAVNVSGCETLRTLDVSATPITSLNAENCTVLEVIDCSDCRLEELKLSGCENLNVLNCSNNSLHMLDAYMFGRLSELLCYNQRITGWRIGRVFSFVEQFAGLLAAADDEADSGVENIINLKAWDADGNEITAEYDSETGTAIFGGIPEKIAYDYITGFGDVKMDVTVSPEKSGIEGVGPNGGGCNTEFAFSVFTMGIVITLFRKKRG